MPTFSSFEEENKQTTIEYDFTDKQSKGAFLSRVFGMMFICLLITTVVAAGLGYGFQALLINAYNSGSEELVNEMLTGLIATLIVVASPY